MQYGAAITGNVPHVLHALMTSSARCKKSMLLGHAGQWSTQTGFTLAEQIPFQLFDRTHRAWSILPAHQAQEHTSTRHMTCDLSPSPPFCTAAETKEDYSLKVQVTAMTPLG